MISTLLAISLGLALASWQLQGMAGRMRPHPSVFRTTPGTIGVFLAAGACLMSGALHLQSFGPIPLILVMVPAILIFCWPWIRGRVSGSSALLAELRRDLEEYRRDYPDLDEEALFRFLVRDRRPSWTPAMVEAMTAGCTSLHNLVNKLRDPD